LIPINNNARLSRAQTGIIDKDQNRSSGQSRKNYLAAGAAFFAFFIFFAFLAMIVFQIFKVKKSSE
jgi:hypothetical protein